MSKFDKSPTKSITLEFPIEVDGQTIKTLVMRRPKVKDSLAAAKHSEDTAERGIFILARLCDVSPEHIAELDEYDSDRLQEQYSRFRGTDVGA